MQLKLVSIRPLFIGFCTTRNKQTKTTTTPTTATTTTMGIIYYVAFRFGGVKDISRIDEEVDYYEDGYVESSRTNLISFSSPLRFGDERKRRLFIYDIQIPENADVICISNAAFDNYEFHTY